MYWIYICVIWRFFIKHYVFWLLIAQKRTLPFWVVFFFGGANALISELSPLGLPGSPKSRWLFGEKEEQGSGRMFSPQGGNEVKRTLL